MTQTTAVAPAQEPAFESDSLHIPDSDRRGWWSIACIWIGNSINVSTLMTGAVLGAGPVSYTHLTLPTTERV